MWRGARDRLGSRFILLTFLVHAILIGGLWLLGLSSEALLHGGAAAKAGMVLPPLVALLGGLGLAWLDSVGRRWFARWSAWAAGAPPRFFVDSGPSSGCVWGAPCCSPC